MALLRKQCVHRSSETSYDKISTQNHFNIETPDPQIRGLIHNAGFLNVSTLGKFKIDPSLVTAMVERWRPETHTFHLPVGECTITLQDVALQLGLPVEGYAVSGLGRTKREYDELCQRLLGKTPPNDQRKGNEVKLKWLENEFKVVPVDAHERIVEYHCRAYMLRLIGGYILPDKSSSRVHLKYLPLLENIENVSQYSWGSACLANLYREMCRASTPSSNCMGGCTLLLQSWVWYRMSFLAPQVSRVVEWPLAKRWVHRGLNFTNTPATIDDIRSRIDHMTVAEFKWLPYKELQLNLPEIAFQHSRIWSAKTALVCFQIVEWHQTDRVKMQFGLMQDIPPPPENLDNLHDLDMRGNAEENWLVRLGQFIQCWDDKEQAVITGHSLQGKPINTEEYMMWLTTNSRLYLSINEQLMEPRGTGGVNEQQEAPTRETNQSQHRSRRRRATPTRPTVEESEEPMPHRHSTYNPPTYQHYESANQSVEYTPQPYRYSTASYDQDFLGPLLSPDYNTPEPYRYYQSILESGPTWNPDQAGPSSSTGYQYEQPVAPAPDHTEQDLPAPRPRRNRRPPRCGTGHHLGE